MSAGMMVRAACRPVLLSAAALTTLAAPAEAAFPGANGDIAYSAPGTGGLEIFRVPPSGGTTVNVSMAAGNEFQPSWSPDGLRIAAAHEDMTGGQRDIHVYSVQAPGPPVEVTDDAPADIHATWSPDGTMIAFERVVDPTPPQDRDIYVAPSDGSGPPTPLISSTGPQTQPAWSPDGTRLAYEDGIGSTTDVKVIAANGTPPAVPIAQSNTGEFQPDWSPDSSRLALTRDGNVLAANADGSGTPQPVVATAATEGDPVWSPDGTRIVFGLGSFPADIATISVSGGGQSPVVNSGDHESGPDWQRIDPPPQETDATPPDTTIVTGPRAKTRRRKAVFQFISSEPGSRFDCKLDQGAFGPCFSGATLKVKRGKHSYEVRATDPAGNSDPTPAAYRWKVRRRRR